MVKCVRGYDYIARSNKYVAGIWSSLKHKYVEKREAILIKIYTFQLM